MIFCVIRSIKSVREVGVRMLVQNSIFAQKCKLHNRRDDKIFVGNRFNPVVWMYMHNLKMFEQF